MHTIGSLQSAPPSLPPLPDQTAVMRLSMGQPATSTGPALTAVFDSVTIAGWSNLAARQTHNLEVGGSNPPPAILNEVSRVGWRFPFPLRTHSALV